ncbi:MAG: c-type cytochrome domain-containing protein [Pirellulaceae bacterium]
MKSILPLLTVLFCVCLSVANAQETVEFTRDVKPLLDRYCVGCHNATEAESDVRLDSFGAFPKQIEETAFIQVGNDAASGLIALMTGKREPKMPPDGEPQPTAEEIQRIASWIRQGATPPGDDAATMRFPKVPPVPNSHQRINAIDYHAGSNRLAVARFGTVDLMDATTQEVVQTVNGFPGKVNVVRFSQDGNYLITGSGIAGASGHIGLWNVSQKAFTRTWETPGDTIYAVDITSDNRRVAAGGYDQTVRVWDVQSGEEFKRLTGHNGSIYGVRFDPSGEVLATASGDETVKLWNVESGRRLSTLGQPLAEQYCVAFASGGRQVVAAGADNRIRVWKLADKSKSQISPLLVARFAHERPIVAIAISPAEDFLCTAAEDGSVKLWDCRDYRLLHQFPSLDSAPSGLQIVDAGRTLIATTLAGSVQRHPIPQPTNGTVAKSTEEMSSDVIVTKIEDAKELLTHQEVEPNDQPGSAQSIQWPSTTTGLISLSADGHGEADYFKFRAQAGEAIIFEIAAQSRKSPLDSRIEVLTVDGASILRAQLQAVRDSYFTFRGKDSTQTGDFRLHNWQEMELNEYLYSSGEVVRLWLYPRGPDSGFEVYPGFGNRMTYFGTTASSHALGEPAYIVRPLAPEDEPLPNGLPVFKVYYSNDDDPQRRAGSDSRLQFVSPADGEYLVRVDDARGFGGDDFAYSLTIRHPQPNFDIAVTAKDLVLRRGVGAEFTVRAARRDGFEGPIQIEIENLPEGFRATTPLWIEKGQFEAVGTITALPTAKSPEADAPPVQLIASAELGDSEIRKPAETLGKLEVNDTDSLLLHLVPMELDQPIEWTPASEPFELVIHPGETVSAKIIAEREDFKDRIEFGREDSGRNLPHGVYVDNIGLNGLMIPEGQTEREFFITAAPWVPETDRLFHLRATVKGRPTSWPMLLKVRKP